LSGVAAIFILNVRSKHKACQCVHNLFLKLSVEFRTQECVWHI
jgi:hypothetical protein